MVQADRHGDLFTRDGGKMIVHVQRENGLAHRTFVFTAWQVRALRILTSRPALVLIALAAISWGYLATQSARVPVLTRRITQLEQDNRRIDTLAAELAQLQTRYDQVQRMLSRPSTGAR
ncbi:MAG: hypothetical protein K2X99_00610 [Gemmatimonadaceae bacterium]|nr:hypothetical protein [Gemmatimonadaceae bacterium]